MASQQSSQSPLQLSAYSKRVILKTIIERSDEGLGLVGERVIIGGWVKSSREKGRSRSAPPPLSSSNPASDKHGEDVNCSEVIQVHVLPCLLSFVRIFVSGRSPSRHRPSSANDAARKSPSVVYLLVNDGSCISSIQMVVDSSVVPTNQVTPRGTCILAEGMLKRTSSTGSHVIELKVEKFLHIGTIDPLEYPLSKSRQPLEFLRSYSHLRSRSTTAASVARIRNALAQATHMFFQDHGLLYVNMPVITSTDTTGSGETFQVTTVFSKGERTDEPKVMKTRKDIRIEVVKAAIKEKSNRIQDLQRSDSNREALLAALLDLQKVNELALQMESQEKEKHEISNTGKEGFSEDYFCCKAYLSSSAQLHLESYAYGLGSVYTFGPTFEAKSFHSTSHLAEAWMVEPEIAFADLEDAMNCGEDYVKFLCKWLQENCSNDINFMSKRVDATNRARLQTVESSKFVRLTYTKAVELLNEVVDKTFETKAEWGINLAEEHERYLADEVFKCPVIIYDYPIGVKPFYARLNDDKNTVAAMDIILPKVGTVMRGSQKEERIDVIEKRIHKSGLSPEMYDWYLDLRRHGSFKHSGFNLSIEHMVMFATGLEDIRDAIPFPRNKGKLTC